MDCLETRTSPTVLMVGKVLPPTFMKQTLHIVSGHRRHTTPLPLDMKATADGLLLH